MLTCDPAIASNTRSHAGDLLLNIFKYTPLDIVYAGSQAVILFFVLSGYVLALPFLTGGAPSYRAFLTRRVLRIYPTYVLAVALAFGACLALGGGGKIPALSGWLNVQWSHPVGWRALIANLTFLQHGAGDTYDPVLWTMVHEMRISLIFPVLLWAVLRRGSRFALPVAVACCVIGFRLTGLLAGDGIRVDYLETLAYASCFIVGIQLAANRTSILAWYRRRARAIRASLLGLAILLYTYPDTVPPLSRWLQARSLEALLTIAGCALLVVIAQGSHTLRAPLRCAPARYLGRISYSLYLTHAIILLAIVHLLFHRLPLWLLVPGFLLCSLATATIVHRFVERPSIRWGRSLAAGVDARRRSGSKPRYAPMAAPGPDLTAR